MLQSYYTQSPQGETEEQYNARHKGYINATLDEARNLILIIYGESCEAARILKEHGIKSCFDMPEERAETILDLLASFEQVKIELDDIF